MDRSSWLKILLALALVVTPLVASLAFWPGAAVAESAAPNTNPDDEIVLLESNGRIRVDDPDVAPGVKEVNWNSGADIGFSAIAAGDFQGDGDAEIVAIRGGALKVFDPIPLLSGPSVLYEYALPSGFTFRLVATGDFDKDGRDEIVAAHTDSQAGTGVVESIKVFDGGAAGASWSVTRSEQFGAPWIDMAVGDVNADGYDDLVLIREALNLVKIFSGANWATLAESSYTFKWLGVAVGNISSTYAGAEIALTRSEVLGQRDSVILLRLSGNTLLDLPPDLVVNRLFYPYFRSITTGDLNGDAGDEEVLLLRDPTDNRVSLMSLNPNGVPMRTFEQSIGFGSTAWKLVRAGDIDGDGRDEVVVLRGDRYRIYREPELSDAFDTDKLGSYLTGAVPSNLSTMVVADVDGSGQALGPTLGVSPQSLTFSLEYGQPSPVQTVEIANIGVAPGFSWQAQVLEGDTWLRVDKTEGATPASLGVSVDTRAVVPGAYTGKIRVSATTAGVANTPLDITVTLNLTGVALRVTPSTLNFTVEYGQSSPQQNVSISSVGGSSAINWQADVLLGQAWLLLNALQGTSPSALGVSVNPVAAGPGTHTGTIRIRTSDSQVADPIQYVTVNLTVPDPGFVVLPSEITLLQTFGGPSVTKNVSIWWPGRSVSWTATGVPASSFAALAEQLAAGEVDAVDWLVFTPASGTTQPTSPTNMTVSIKPGTPKGSYTAFIVVTSPGADAPKYVKVIGVVADQIRMSYLPLVKQ